MMHRCRGNRRGERSRIVTRPQKRGGGGERPSFIHAGARASSAMGCWLSGPWVGDPALSQRDALRILAASRLPVTMQVKSQRGGGGAMEADPRGAWEPLPLNLQHLNLPLPRMPAGLNAASPAYQDRHYFGHLSLPQDHCDGGRFGYLPSSPRDTVDAGHQDPDVSGRRAKERNCLMGCCNVNLDEPKGYHGQPDDDDFMLEKPLGFLPFHHELDSGLGWTDGSLHQGDLSGLETEEAGLEDCHSRGALGLGGRGAFGPGGGGGGSPSSESFISSELSDSGFYSVSTGEFRHFQRMLEKRMRLYNARLQHQGETCERRERRDSCPMSHRELLEAIPETLTVQPPCQRLQMGMEESPGAILDVPNRGLFRVSSVQFHKTDRPCLNRHSSSSGALFNPSHAHTAVPRMSGPVLSTCSTPSSHRRPLAPTQQPHHQGPGSAGMLRRSRTLHHRPPQQEYRRRASHPASPSYCAATLHRCGAGPPHGLLQPGLPEETEMGADVMASPLSAQQHPVHIRVPSDHELRYNSNPNAHHEWWQQMTLMPDPLETEQGDQMERDDMEKSLEREARIQEEVERDFQRSRAAREQRHLQGAVHLAQPGDVNDTWPKPASRQAQGGGGGARGLYSTLEGHTGATPATALDAKKAQPDTQPPTSGLQPKVIPCSKPSTTSRVSRNQLLRDRASQLADERSGMSTDEETSADMLLGRYWNRTERREHFLLAREQKQQQARGGAGTGPGSGPPRSPVPDARAGGAVMDGRCNTVLEMSQRKLSRLRNRKMLDDWTTVEELLTHGTRLDSHDHRMLCARPLLTVTTV
ncbi:uncharacterized protein LOC133483650 [Phyllopteryx taeniolatus]|uniref:uncharacterized protein LOC133483650 n=1 Tax=Phyllopteryx taeniolatus TaxID=161469 RepID=UPI002AD3B64A|nr:uncharacterized protein LOC133483650 [Phyllopteryx taeniolatus]XP_061641127.1 uncharacterized protein LOC133483650 [Phyllopteryx taeniolatus]XP_061641128.1 uncharacterized protein LOC133483650 [Phyllopteryx taeniolatus]